MSKASRIFQLQGLNLWLLFGSDVSHFRWGVSASWDLVKWWWYHLIFWHFFQILLIFDRLLTFLRCKDNWLFGTDAGLVHYGWKPWTLFKNVIPYISTGYHTRYDPNYHVFTGVLYCFQSTTIISLLLHQLLFALLYIFSKSSTYLHDFQRVIMRITINFLYKRKYMYFFKKTDGNASQLGKCVENWQLSTYFTENALDLC